MRVNVCGVLMVPTGVQYDQLFIIAKKLEDAYSHLSNIHWLLFSLNVAHIRSKIYGLELHVRNQFLGKYLGND